MSRNELTSRARATYDKYVGKTFINNDGEKFTVTDYINSNNSTIIFEDGTIKTGVRISLAETGQIRNPNFKNNNKIFGKYISGIGKYSKINTPEIYRCWYNILLRCNDKIFQEKEPTYIGCELCKEWWNLQEFGKWYEQNYINNFTIDKDILIKGNKLYSPETCCFVPKELNNLLTKANNIRNNLPIGVCYKKQLNKYSAQLHIGDSYKFLGYYDTVEKAFLKYKEEKENYIKFIAEKYKSIINENVYKALINYKVEITD